MAGCNLSRREAEGSGGFYSKTREVNTSSSKTRKREELSAASSKNVRSVSECSTQRNTPMDTIGCLQTETRGKGGEEEEERRRRGRGGEEEERRRRGRGGEEEEERRRGGEEERRRYVMFVQSVNNLRVTSPTRQSLLT